VLLREFNVRASSTWSVSVRVTLVSSTLQEKAELLEAQAGDLMAQLHAAQDRNAVLQQQLSGGYDAHADPAIDESHSATELHAKCQVRS
jgi:hypothetical protein